MLGIGRPSFGKKNNLPECPPLFFSFQQQGSSQVCWKHDLAPERLPLSRWRSLSKNIRHGELPGIGLWICRSEKETLPSYVFRVRVTSKTAASETSRHLVDPQQGEKCTFLLVQRSLFQNNLGALRHNFSRHKVCSGSSFPAWSAQSCYLASTCSACEPGKARQLG